MKPMKAERCLHAALLLGAAATWASLALGCETEDPTRIVVDNAYPAIADGGDVAAQIVVYKVWWEVTLFTEPVLPGETSGDQRGVPQTATAYALLAPGWDPQSGAPPARLVVVRSKEPLGVARGATLRIGVSDATFAGNCAAGQPLPEEEARFITERIFPGDFANVIYDAKTCTTSTAAEGG
jgi:hypothetical protein